MPRDASTQAAYDPAVADAALARLLACLRGNSAPYLVGLSGLQGSGKSTLAEQIAHRAREVGVRTTVVSIDDFYFGRRERARLARRVHPLLQTRGVPGTHDMALLRATLESLAHACARAPARLPRFDKGRDTRRPPSRWRNVVAAPQLILLEGWCIGVPAQASAELREPINALERGEDPAGRWRTYVNSRLVADYMPLWARLDALVLLEAPSFAVVSRWRDEQERPLRARRAPHALDAAGLARFLMHYERLSRHALRVLPAKADVRLVLDRRRGVSFPTAAGRAR